MIAPRDPIRALMLLTRLPIPGGDGARMAESAWAWPLVGAVVAALQIGVGLGALFIGLPVGVAAGFALAAGIFATGALHEDGFADCADGFWGGYTPERRLEILKDSRIGAYGVLALILGVGIRWALYAALLPIAPLALIAGAMLSRAGMAVLMGWMPFARADGLAAHVGRPGIGVVVLGCGLAFLGGAALIGVSALAAGLATALIAGGIARLAHTKIGGQTGDVLGAAQVAGEIAALVTVAALVS